MIFTVGIPVYNAAPYLREAITSILEQTYADFELLVINDGSTDESAAILASIADPRLRVIHQENRGLPATLNRMLDEAKGTWLVRHDADDIAYPHRLEKIAAAVAAHPDAAMIYSLADYYQNGIRFGTFRTTQNTAEELRGFTRSGYLLSVCHPSVALQIAKTKALGGYRTLKHVEDIDLWARITLEHDAIFIPEKLLGMRINNESVSSNNLYEQALKTIYVQYLLLSTLWGFKTEPFEAIRSPLETLLNRADLQAKAYIRQIGIRVAQRHFIDAIWAAFMAILASPRFFIKRFLLELKPSTAPVINGQNPERFRELASSLWPQQK